MKKLSLGIQNISFLACHGIYAHEKRVPQPFKMDLSIGIEASLIHNLSLDDALPDYEKVSSLVREHAIRSTFPLIEQLASSLTDLIWSHWEAILWSEIRIEKEKAFQNPKLGIPYVTLFQDRQ